MARDGGFPVDDQEVLETVAQMHGAAGEAEAAAALRSGRCRFALTDHDNWDSGTNVYTLRIQIAAETFLTMGERRTELEEQIKTQLGEVTKQFRSGWCGVELVPLVVALPGRPDLEGGPVPRRVRQAIVRLLQDEGVVWHGALDDTAYLGPLYDLAALPSGDSRFENAAGDVWQHRGSVAQISLRPRLS